MENSTMQNPIISNSFLSPFGVVAATFLLNTLYEKYKNWKGKKQRKILVLEDLILYLDRINNQLESLKSDGENNMFWLTNIKPAMRVAKQLQKISENSFELSDNTLRLKILENIEALTSLIEDIESLEKYVISENSKFNELERNSLEELRALKLNVLKLSVGINYEGKAYPLSKTEKNKPKTGAVQQLFIDLNNNYLYYKKNLETIGQSAKDRRIHLSIRVIDIQTKLRELSGEAKEKKKHL